MLKLPSINGAAEKPKRLSEVRDFQMVVSVISRLVLRPIALRSV